MGLLVFLVKPLFYLFAFGFAAYRFKALRRPTRLPTPLVVIFATLARLALGVPVGFLAMWTSNDGPLVFFAATIVPIGFVLWYAVAHVAFGSALGHRLVIFALLAEAVSGTIDVWAWHDVRSISFC
jgi:hypothetical protein